MTNADLEKIVDTNDEWIRTPHRDRGAPRRGAGDAHQRAVPAAPPASAWSCAASPPDEIDLIIVATITPDMVFPATACILQDKLKATQAWGFDISAACSGFVYALTMGAQFVQTGAHKKVLVLGADVMSSILDYKDRTTCVLFGDGAGAVLLEPSGDDNGIIDFAHEVDGSGACYLNMPAGGSLQPTSHETVDAPRALRPPGRRARLQVRGAQVRGGEPRPPRAQRDDARRASTCSSPTRRTSASSTRRKDRLGPAGIEGGQEHPAHRQHHRGHHPPRPGHRPRRRSG